MENEKLDLEAIQQTANPKFGFDNLGGVVTGFLNIVYPIVGMLLLLYLLSGGLQLMTSKGDPKAVEGAKMKITNAIIGVVIVFVSYWLVQIIIQFLGIKTGAVSIFGLDI